MAFPLICQGEVHHDMLDDEGDDGDDSWTFSHRLVKHLAPKVKANLHTNESMS